MFQEISQWANFNGWLFGWGLQAGGLGFLVMPRPAPSTNPYRYKHSRSGIIIQVVYGTPQQLCYSQYHQFLARSLTRPVVPRGSVKMNEKEMAEGPEVIPRVDKGNPAHLQRIVISNPEYSYSHLKM